ncbi:MAG: nodulation protein NfeD [Solirubrobacterales bacterium]|nr:nodulation protein NfeD [Solirubrobacterales bacterium]
MKRALSTLFGALAILVLAVVVPASAQTTDSETIPSIELSGEISPATEAWIGHALDQAADEGAPLAIIRLDTPGGLDSSLREIVKDMIAAPMPVVVYVTPAGARAASAGVFITEAADVAAMAPETNIGSASPISADGSDIGDTLGRKITNDAAAFVRALATTHGRNPELAERMVREATNVTSQEALDAGLIDLIATDEDDLLGQLDGFVVKGPKAGTLATEGLSLDERDMPFQYDLLQVLVNPNVAFLLLLIGFVGISLEFFAPGTILPGSVGVVSLLLGLFGTVQLPVEAIGVVLLIVAVGLIIAEAHLPTGGLLGIAGVAALIAGGLLLFDTGNDDYGISPVLVVFVALIFGGLTVLVGQKAMAARHRPVATGQEELLGSTAEVRTAIDPIGQVFLDGALWRARSADSSDPIGVGYRVRVEAIDGLTLSVSPLETLETGAADAAAQTAPNNPEGS